MPRVRRGFRFSLSALLIGITAICIVLGWQMSRAHRQARAVRELLQLQATIVYDYDKEDREPSEPKWLRRLLGPHYFDRVVGISIGRPDLIGDDEARWLADLPDFKRRNEVTSDEFAIWRTCRSCNGLTSAAAQSMTGPLST